MKKPRAGEWTIAKDRCGNKVLHHTYIDGGLRHDLQTDGRVVLDATLARKLAAWLTAFAETLGGDSA